MFLKVLRFLFLFAGISFVKLHSKPQFFLH
jgi:hypothetical protein